MKNLLTWGVVAAALLAALTLVLSEWLPLSGTVIVVLLVAVLAGVVLAAAWGWRDARHAGAGRLGALGLAPKRGARTPGGPLLPLEPGFSQTHKGPSWSLL